MKAVIKYISLTLVSILLTACADDLLYKDRVIGEGEGALSATVCFFPEVESLATRATNGDVIEEINNLSVIVYDHNGNLYDVYNSVDGDFTYDKEKTHENKPTMSEEDASNGGVWSDRPQAYTTFELKEKFPYGRYKVYCVANMGKITKEQAETQEKLQNITLEWKSNVTENNQMFGYFTPADEASKDKPIAGFQANEIIIDQTKQAIHAWLKRAVSKVTLAFDGSGLNQEVFIYIRKATIKDIPATCLLGADNTPVANEEGADSPLIADGETIWYKNVLDSATGSENGEIVDSDPGDDWHDWMRITNSVNEAGDHSYNAPSLFFFENMQGDYKDRADKEIFNKQPKFSDVQAFLDELAKDPNASPSSFDTKDNVPMGTYIEVEGYYVSNNPNNIGWGPIKYRFMLGKNETYNYNAQRNHHYKLTLKFKGWANQPEWHIDYIQDNPGMYVPDRFYMPYLYNQRVEMPIRLNGNCKELKVEIIANDWGPHLENDPTKVPAHTVSAKPNDSAAMDPDYYDFVWNTYAWSQYNGMEEGTNNGAGNFYLGFLALTKRTNDPDAQILNNYDFNQGTTAYQALKQFYNGEGQGNTIPQGERTLTDFTKGEHNTTSIEINSYDVISSDDNGCTLLLPMFTRPLSMIYGSGYTGNNPYASFIRYAKLRLTATFGTPNGDKTVTNYVDVLQVPRITNPKAIWRKSGSQETFDVILTSRSGEGLNSDYQAFTSEGEWTVEVDDMGQSGNFTLAETDGQYMPGSTSTKITGRTGSQIRFRVNFGGTDGCGALTVKYNGGTCIHRIFLRQGYGTMQVNNGGPYWSCYNVYSSTGAFNANGNQTVNATLVKSPMSIGSLFKKGNYQQGILIKNNNTWGSLANGPYNFELSNGNKSGWAAINYISSRYYYYRGTLYTINETWQWAKFAANNNTYRVPTYAEFEHLTNNSDYGFGIMYGDGASVTQLPFNMAEGFMDEDGSTESSTMGVRGVIVYNKEDARQIFFPMGKFAQGRRTEFNLDGENPGVLRYGDVTNPLTQDINPNNMYRPIPYNLGHQAGSLYWLRGIKYDHVVNQNSDVANGAWDMNYFSFDFSRYTNNCYRDALPIKLVEDR